MEQGIENRHGKNADRTTGEPIHSYIPVKKDLKYERSNINL